MEFISENEVYEVLKEFGIERVSVDDDHVELQMHSDDSIVRFHLASEGTKATPHDGSETITIEKERLSNVVEHMQLDVEFISENEVYEVLKEFGIERVSVDDDHVELQMHSDDSIVRFHLASEGTKATPHDGSETITIEKERLSNVVEHMLHLLHVTQILLIPLGKWRSVFDAVAFSLAESEAWQAVDAGRATYPGGIVANQIRFWRVMQAWQQD